MQESLIVRPLRMKIVSSSWVSLSQAFLYPDSYSSPLAETSLIMFTSMSFGPTI